MPEVNLPHNVTLGVGSERYNLEAGTQTVDAKIEKALQDAGLIEAPKKKPTQTEK